MLVLATSGFFWFVSERWLRNPVWSLADIDPWLMPLAGLVVLAASLGIAFMLIPEYWVKIVASALSALPFIVIFGLEPIYLGAACILVALHIKAIESVGDEVKSRITVRAKHIVRRGMSMIILPHMLLISFAYYQTPAVKNAGKDLKLPAAITQAIEGTTRTFLGPELEKLPAAERKKVEGQIINQAVHQITELAKPYLHYMPPLLAFGLFLALQGLSPIFFELGSWLGLLMFLLLKKTGFIMTEEKQVKAEIIKL